MGKKAFRLGWLALATLLVLVVFVPAEIQAGIKPCCEGGSNPGKFCTFDSDCPDACVGGAHDGKPCASANCPSACVGGKKDGNVCDDDSDCFGSCIANGADCLTNADCAGGGGGVCTNLGSCSNHGTCGNPGGCTGQCLSKGKGPKPSPGDPIKAGDAGSEGPLACFEPTR